MDRPFKQGEPSAHLVKKRINSVQACLVVEPSFVVFVLAAKVGEVGHCLLRLAHGREGMVKPPVLPFSMLRHNRQTLFD